MGDAILNKSGHCYNGINECAGILSFENSRNCSQANTIYQYCNIQDVDKFREFLNDEIHSLEMKSRDEYGHSDNLNDLKSILSKLDKAVHTDVCKLQGSQLAKNDEPREFKGHCPECSNKVTKEDIEVDNCCGSCFADLSKVQNGEPKTKEVWNGYGKGTRTISIVQNDEPRDNLLERCADALQYMIDSEYVQWDALKEYSGAEELIKEIKNNKPKDETLEKLTDIVNWVEDKYDGDELREHMIVKTIKEDLLS